MSKDKDITEAEEALWLESMQGTKKLDKKEKIQPTPTKIFKRYDAPRRYREAVPDVYKAPETLGPARHMPKNKTRKLHIEARLDLHGMTQEQAFQVLQRFLKRCQQDHKLWVLVITGKGSGAERAHINQGQGVLQAAVPEWLNHPPLSNITSGYSYARPHDGGHGAFYVRLKKIPSIADTF